jgi:DNA polymerase I
VRGAKYSNKYLKTDFKQGSKPKRVYIKGINGTKYPATNVLCFEYGDQVPNDFIIDWEIMLEKTIKQPISRITDALGWQWNELIDPSKKNTKTTTLEQWGFG